MQSDFIIVSSSRIPDDLTKIKYFLTGTVSTYQFSQDLKMGIHISLLWQAHDIQPLEKCKIK